MCTGYDEGSPLVANPLGCDSVTTSALSNVGILSMLDGGTAVSVDIGSSTINTYSGLMTTKSVGELAFGYPFVLGGYLMAGKVAEATLAALTPEVTKQVVSDDTISPERKSAEIGSRILQGVADGK